MRSSDLSLDRASDTRGTWLIPRRIDRPELIDSFDQSDEDFRQTFRDLRTINRLFGGISLVQSRLSELIGSSRQPVSILDVGTGSADIPLAILEWSSKRQIPLRIVASDANPEALRCAQAEPNLELMLCDATALPFEDDSFDFVLCSLMLHHFDDVMAIKLLREMHRVSRRAIIINDLQRACIPAGLIWLITRLFGMNRLTRHDAPLSVMRSRTLAEYRDLARRSGLTNAKVYSHPFWRAALVARKAL
jgi:SAM-dependent methyltransferase